MLTRVRRLQIGSVAANAAMLLGCAKPEPVIEPFPPRGLSKASLNLGDPSHRDFPPDQLARSSPRPAGSTIPEPSALPECRSVRSMTPEHSLKHRGDVFRIAFSRNGRRVATASNDKSVKIWDTATGKLLETLRGHRDGVTGVSWSANDRTLASTSFDGGLRGWDPSSGRLRWKLDYGKRLRAVDFHPTAPQLLVGGDGTPLDLVAENGEPIRSLADSVNVWDVAFGPRGHRAVTLGGSVLRVWSTENPQVLWQTTTVGSGTTSAAAFSPDGRMVLTPVDHAKRVGTWASHSGQAVARFSPAETWLIPSVAWSPLGTLAVGQTTGEVSVWCPQNPIVIKSSRQLQSNVIDVAFSPDGQQLAAGGYDNVVQLWRLDLDR